MEKFAGATVG
jgi:hypothetical protein